MAEIPEGGSNWFSAHTHSNFSTLDGMTTVERLVEKAARMGQPALGLTDHGNMGGAVQLYKAGKKYGIDVFPGLEGYLIDPKTENWEAPTRGQKVKRYHFGLLALTEDGYKGLVKFTSLTHTRPRFNRFPRATLSDLASLGRDYGRELALTTGCYFGLIQQALVNEGLEEAEKYIDMLSGWFPHMFVELQNHGIEHVEDGTVHPHYPTDNEINVALASIAKSNNLPLIAGQDSHYVDQREKSAHAIMKRMVYGGAEDEFPGDSFHLASAEWVAEHYTQRQWDRIEQGHEELLSLHNLRIKPLDKFAVDVPKLSKNPKKKFRELVDRELTAYLSQVKSSRHGMYYERVEYELGIIEKLGMSEYFNIVRDYVEWCHTNDYCIEARGSGNGSLVCFLAGITQIDPLIDGVDFDRFLSVDRIKAPDIDMDVDDSARPALVEYLLQKYGAVQIGTWGKLGTRYDEREDTERGSVLVTYLSGKRRQAETIAARKIEEQGGRKGDIKALAGRIFNSTYGGVTDIRDLKRVNPKDYKGLRIIAEMGSVYKSYGTHAGGILLSGQNVKIEDYIPTMLVASSNTRVTQFDMDDVEEFGLLKMDILGQATLRTMRIAQELIGREDPADFSWIPRDDPKACAILRENRQGNGVFHFEAPTKARGGKELGIKSTKDAILATAIYMPGAMETGQKDHVIRARKDRYFREEIEYLHPIFEKHLKETYGAYVYQNQVMSILRDMGFDVPSINIFLKVVKDSGAGALERNAERILPLKKTFDSAWKKLGIDEEHRDETWASLCGFAAYGFNKAHAAGYGVRSYRCAYLKAHYPAEFMTGLLQTWAGRDKETQYVREARRIGIRLMPPSVNTSGESWTLDKRRKAIRRGLVSIKGVGTNSAIQIAEAAPFESIEDMVSRLPARVITGGKKFLETGELSGTIQALYDAGALEDFEEE